MLSDPGVPGEPNVTEMKQAEQKIPTPPPKMVDDGKNSLPLKKMKYFSTIIFINPIIYFLLFIADFRKCDFLTNRIIAAQILLFMTFLCSINNCQLKKLLPDTNFI